MTIWELTPTYHPGTNLQIPENMIRIETDKEASSNTESSNEIQGPAWQCPGFHLSSEV